MLSEVEQIQIPRKHGKEKTAQEGEEIQTRGQWIRTKKTGRDSRNTLKVKRATGSVRHMNFNVSRLKKGGGVGKEKC